MDENESRLIGDWVIQGTAEMSGRQIPIRGTQKGYMDSKNKFIFESDLILDFGKQKTSWKSRVVEDPPELASSHEATYKIVSDKFGEGEGKTIFLPNCTHMVDKSINLGLENHHITYWLNNKESREVTYSVDDSGHKTGVWEFSRKPK